MRTVQKSMRSWGRLPQFHFGSWFHFDSTGRKVHIILILWCWIYIQTFNLSIHIHPYLSIPTHMNLSQSERAMGQWLNIHTWHLRVWGNFPFVDIFANTQYEPCSLSLSKSETRLRLGKIMHVSCNGMLYTNLIFMKYKEHYC